jgi:hypothetical protein
MKMPTRATLALAVCALTLAGTAAGYTAGRTFIVRRGDAADFRPGFWRCFNPRTGTVVCFTGDARPYVKIGVRHRCRCVALKVYNYRDAPRPTRSLDHGDAVYTFRALR